MGHFTIKSKKVLSEMNEGDIISESDYATLTPDGTFVQLTYVTDEKEFKKAKYPVKSGLFIIRNSMKGCYLEETEMNNDSILEDFVHCKGINEKIDTFFNKAHLYKELGFDVAKRCLLFYGPPGSGKSTSINKAVRTYKQDGKTLVLIWNTDVIEAHDVKNFISTFEYKDVERVLLIAEDIGGTEVSGGIMRSDSSLLSLLDNQEKAFTLPTMLICTTNYPENLMGNLTNRPGRIDDKIAVSYPPADARIALFRFFGEKWLKDEDIKLIGNKKYEQLTPAHLKEIIVRVVLFDKTAQEAIDEVSKQIKVFDKGFNDKNNSLGLSRNDDDYEY